MSNVTSMLKYTDKIDNEGCNLAFVDAPKINSTTNTKVIDFTNNIPILMKDKEKTFYLEDESVSISKNDFSLIDNKLLITNVFKKIADKSYPLYFKYKTKFQVNRAINITKQFFVYDCITQKKAEYKDLLYKLVPIKTSNDCFDLYLFFNNADKIYERFYIYYKDTNNVEHKEFLSPEFAFYPRHKDYLISNPVYNFEYYINETDDNFIIHIKSPYKAEQVTVNLMGYHDIKASVVDNLAYDEKWPIKIKNGYFEVNNISKNRKKFVYTLKEYNEQIFDTYGPPYKRIKETPKTVEDKILVTNPFIYDRKEIKVRINDKYTFTNVDFINVDKINGVIKLPKKISKHDKVEIEYTAIIEHLEYNGYYDFNSRKKINFNINPYKGNIMNYVNKDGDVINKPVFQTMKKPIYLYLKPTYTYYCDKVINDEKIEYLKSIDIVQVSDKCNYVTVMLSESALTEGFCVLIKELNSETIQRGTNNYLLNDKPYWTFDNENAISNDKIRIYNANLLKGQNILFTYVISNDMKLSYINENNSIFHTLDFIPQQECDNNGYLLLAEIYCYPNSNIEDLSLIDIRTRGGGVTQALEDDIRELIEPSSNYYWDIGFIDGEEIGAKYLCFRFDKQVLSKNNLTEQIIRESIEKHIDLGCQYLLEFVDINNHIKV